MDEDTYQFVITSRGALSAEPRPCHDARMEIDVLDHVLTADEHQRFEHDGYLLVPQALTSDQIARLMAVSDQELDRYRATPGESEYHVLNLHDLIGRDRAFLDLIDSPTTFAKVWGILGWHIQLFHTPLIVTPPAPAGADAGAYGWHQDNNRMNLDLETSPQPRVSVKVGYFLSEVSQPGMANLWVVPGSHLQGRPVLASGQQPDGQLEVTAAAGDAIIFDRRLWHSASTNTSSTTRVFLTYGYSYRWLRPKSRMDHDELAAEIDPIRRQLLGYSSGASNYFDPTDDDVPLRTWIAEHLGDDALVP